MNGTIDARRANARLLGKAFDQILVAAPVLIGLAALLAVTQKPALFLPILLADLWFLGYHHVIATYLRLGLDAQTRAHHVALWLLLPIMLGLVALVAWAAGVWVVTTIYFFWQWFHYVRQSWGIALVLRTTSGAERRLGRLDKAVFWLVPIAGITWRCAEQHALFLNVEFWTPAAPQVLAQGLAVIAASAASAWLFRAIRRGREEHHLGTWFIASHLGMFAVGYILTADIDHGWLAINIWHNLQYLLFVYAFNRKRYRTGTERESRIISWLSQPGRILYYFGFSMLLTLVIYEIGMYFAFSLSEIGVAGLVVVFQALNFHHYVADSRIWKLRQPAIKNTLHATS